MEIKLKDGGYSDDLMATLNTLRKTGELCDVILKVDNDKVFASRVILAAKSQYFRSMFFGSFRESASPTTEIDLTGIAANISIVEQCVSSLYCGKITLTTETVIDVFILSSYLTLDNILDCCKYFALKTLDLDMVMDYYVLTRRIQLTELSQLISVILKCRFHDVFVLDQDNKISEDIIKELFSQGMFRFCTCESLTHFLDKNNVSDDEIRKSVLSSFVDKDINVPGTQNRPCLLFIAKCDERVKNSSISPLPDSVTESVTEDEQDEQDESTQIALVIYDISRRMWLNLGHTFLPFDFELDDDWKSVLVQNRVFFMNEKTNFGFRLCLDNLTWYRFGTDCLWNRVKDPIKFMELVQLNGNLYILVITSTLSNTSHMWIKRLRYFKMTDDFSFMPVYEDIRHCHDELVLRFLGKTESRAYFCESGPIVPLMFEEMPGISIEECYHFDANTEESKYYYPPINITVPVFIVTDNEDDIYMIDDTTVKYKYRSTGSFWEEVQSNEADPEIGENLPRLSLHLFCEDVPEFSGDTPQLSGGVPHSQDLPRLSEDLFGKDFTQLKKYLSQFGENFIENSSYTFETDTVWKLDTQTKFCNYLVEITMQDGNLVKRYHPPPPYLKCLYFHVGNINSSILAPLTQASFQNRF